MDSHANLRARIRQAFDQWIEFVNERPKLWLAACAAVSLLVVSPHWHPTADACSYLSMARSLAHEGRLLNLGRLQLWYAPGYSILISPLFLISDRPFWLLTAAQWGMAVLAMFGAYRWAKTIAPQAAVWVAALGLVNVKVWMHCCRTLSEMAFACCLIWTANLLLPLTQTRSGRTGRVVVAAGLLMLTCLVRPAGITLAAGLGIAMLRAAHRQVLSWSRAIAVTLAVGVPAALLLLGFILRERSLAAAAEGNTYLDNFAVATSSPWESYQAGLQMAVSDVGRLLVPGMFNAYSDRRWLDWNMAVYLPLAIVVLAGWLRLARATVDPLIHLLPFYVVLHAVYAMDAGTRFYVPLVSLLALCTWAAANRLGTHRLRIAGLLMLAHLGVAVGHRLANDMPRIAEFQHEWADVEAIAAAIGDDRDAVVLDDSVSLSTEAQLEFLLDRPVRRGNLHEITGSPQPRWYLSNAGLTPWVNRTTR